MPEPVQPEASRPDRSAAERSADHAAIDRLSGELLPALIAKLGATGLGELEIREGAWHVRLRRPADGAPTSAARDRRPGERERSARGPGAPTTAYGQTGLTPVGPGRDGRDGERDGRDGRDGRESRLATAPPATRDGSSPARRRSASSSRGPTPAPARGCGPATGSDRSTCWASRRRSSPRPTASSGASLVEAGDAVEYGQELILIEFATASPEA